MGILALLGNEYDSDLGLQQTHQQADQLGIWVIVTLVRAVRTGPWQITESRFGFKQDGCSIDPYDASTMRLYSDLAAWFPLVTHRDDYKEEAAYIAGVLKAACDGPVETLMELGCGGGNNASHLKQHFSCTLTDLSDDMLAVSRRLNPECEHIHGDMRTLRLERQFDAVLAHDAICYMTNENDLAAVMATVAHHLRSGGLAVLIPDEVTETFQPGVRHGGHDGDDGLGLRYLEWTHPVPPGETAFDVDYAFMIREPDQEVRVEHDHHRFGLFPRRLWRDLIETAGLRLVDTNVPDPYADEHVVFVARKTA